MSSLDDKIAAVNEELEKITKQYEYVNTLSAENKIEQEKIVEQNLNIKNRIEELATSQKQVNDKEKDLSEREKQILIKEKSIIASNRLLDEKLLDFRQKSLELTQQEKKLQQAQEEYRERKKLVDQQALINQKMEETEILRKNKIKFKEEQIDKELDRLKNLSL